MEIFTLIICTIFVLFYLIRPITNKEKQEFENKSNWRSGF